MQLPFDGGTLELDPTRILFLFAIFPSSDCRFQDAFQAQLSVLNCELKLADDISTLNLAACLPAHCHNNPADDHRRVSALQTHCMCFLPVSPTNFSSCICSIIMSENCRSMKAVWRSTRGCLLQDLQQTSEKWWTA